MRRSSWAVTGIGLVALAAGCARTEPAPAEKAEPAVTRVAAASDLAGTLEELGARFEKRTGAKVSLSFGASGLFAKQLEEGAPFDVFLAADASFADRAVKSGACDAASRAEYARGRLGVFTRTAAGDPPIALADLANPRFRKIAIANPDHAPYGRAAREALVKSGLWTALEPRIVYGENVRQAMQMAESGNAEAAIVAYSHARRAKNGSTLEVDPALFTPLDQVVVACKRGKNAGSGAEFARFVVSPEAREVFARGGFSAPGGGAP